MDVADGHARRQRGGHSAGRRAAAAATEVKEVERMTLYNVCMRRRKR